MASIIDIPNELLEPILAKTSFHDLLSLSRTCRALHASTIPALYHDLTLFLAAPRFSKITSLLRTVLKRPAYSEHIKIVEITPKVHGWRNPPDDCRLQENEKEMVERAIDELQLPHAEQWKAAIMNENNQAAVLSVLLLRCTNLQSLTMTVSTLEHLERGEWFPTMLKHAITISSGAEQLSRFDNLRHVAVSGPKNVDEEVALSEDVLLPFLYLPELVRLELDATPNLTYSDWPLSYAPVATNLTTLRLRFSTSPDDTVQFLLMQTPRLNSLFFDCQMPSAYGGLDLDKLRQGLDHVRCTLSSLTIKYGIFQDIDDNIEPETMVTVVKGSLGSLRNFTALTDLEVSLAVLYGQSPPNTVPPLMEVLPPVLQRLTINDDLWDFDALYQWVGEPVMALFQAFFGGGWNTATPHLQEFVLDLRNQNRGWIAEDYCGQEEQREELRHVCESRGLKCSIPSWDDE